LAHPHAQWFGILALNTLTKLGSIIKLCGQVTMYATGSVDLVKVKCTLVQALRLCTGRMAHRGSKDIALLFLDHGTRRGEGSASRPGCSFPPGKTRYPL
jgi:hypothetical protein